jgi:hypothetical protein
MIAQGFFETGLIEGLFEPEKFIGAGYKSGGQNARKGESTVYPAHIVFQVAWKAALSQGKCHPATMVSRLSNRRTAISRKVKAQKEKRLTGVAGQPLFCC